MPGDVSLYAKELACQQKIPTPGYYSSLNGAEICRRRAQRRVPLRHIPRLLDGPNKVYAWRSEDDYQGVSYINNRKPGELYIVGGEYPTLDDPVPAGPYIAKADATTGRQIWRTYLDNANASGRWIGNANLNILANGNIAFAWSNQIVLLDGDTGLILKHNTLPTGDAPARHVNFKHLTIAPDGTLIMKDQTRPVGCTLQGTMAIIKCIAGGHEEAELGAGRGRSRHARGAGQLPAARAGTVAAHRHDVPGQDRHLRRHGRQRAALLLGSGDEEALGRRVVGHPPDAEGPDGRHRADA